MTVRFRQLTFDPARRQVVGPDGAPLHLTPKAFDLLAFLIEQAPAVVTKAAIHQRLWPQAFVADVTLVGLVKELRRVLEDEDRANPIIRTVHRVGYAFCAIDTPSAWLARPEHWVSDGRRRIALHGGHNLIGRDPAADVWIDLAGVSRRHARVVVHDGRAEIEDLGSKNGTKVGSELVTGPRLLSDGDAIEVGPGRITYRLSMGGMSTETTPRR